MWGPTEEVPQREETSDQIRGRHVEAERETPEAPEEEAHGFAFDPDLDYAIDLTQDISFEIMLSVDLLPNTQPPIARGQPQPSHVPAHPEGAVTT